MTSEERNSILMENYGLVVYFTQMWRKMNRSMSIDECWELVVTAMFKAVETWDSTKSTFATWSEYYIRSEFRNHRAKRDAEERMCPKELWLDNHISIDYFYLKNDIFLSSPKCINEVITKVCVEDLLSRLTPEERELIRLIYWENKSYRELGRMLGCSRQTVWNRAQSIIEKMRKAGGIE